MKNSFFLFSVIIVFTMSCGKKDTRRKFNTPEEYSKYVQDCVKESQNAYQQTVEFPNGREYCEVWCDSTQHITERNLGRLDLIQPFKGDSSLTVSAREFILQLHAHVSGKDMREYISLIFSTHDRNSDYQSEYEMQLDELAQKLNSTYQEKLDHYEDEKKKISIRYNTKK